LGAVVAWKLLAKEPNIVNRYVAMSVSQRLTPLSIWENGLLSQRFWYQLLIISSYYLALFPIIGSFFRLAFVKWLKHTFPPLKKDNYINGYEGYYIQ
jgi:pimeloyl-ACP methyl ester carboxylesterase